MDQAERDKRFRKGLGMFRRGMLSEATAVFQQLVTGGSDDPRHLSFCGLLTATVKGRRREGLQLCERAMALGGNEPEFAANLARLYELTGERTKAVVVLRRGLRETPDDPRMLEQINRLSPRQVPPLSFLSRDHFLNRHLSTLLAKAGYRAGPESGTRLTRLQPAFAKPQSSRKG